MVVVVVVVVKVFPSLFIKNCVRGAKKRLGYLASRPLRVWFPSASSAIGLLGVGVCARGLAALALRVWDCRFCMTARGRLQSFDDLMPFAVFSSWLVLGYTPLKSGASSSQRSRSA